MNIIWLIFVCIFVIIEALTVNLVSIWAAIGALFALITYYLTDNIGIQITVFFVVTILVLLIVKKFVKSKIEPVRTPTNLDAVIGKIGTVTKEVDDNSGRVKVMGKDWAARTKNDEKIEVNKKVEILEIKGVKLIVKEVKK